MTVQPFSTTETAAERTRRLWDGTFAGTAQALLIELGVPGEAVAVLLPWITDRVRNTIRNQVREAEENVWPAGGPKMTRHATAVRSQAGALPALNDLTLLLSLPVLVPSPTGTQAKAWKDMTIADHQARIGALRRSQKGLQRTVDRHEWAIREIKKWNVNTLGDIDIAVLRTDF